MKVDLNNARDTEQLRRMTEHLANNTCHFCPEGFSKHGSPVIFRSNLFFITANDFPYEGSVHHYLIVPNRHIENIIDITKEEWSDMHDCINYLSLKLNTKGYSIFIRSGETKITGGTLFHIHIHFVVGIEKKGEKHEMIFAPIGYKNP
jgi:diadenosine tetraphosphate (Ap4A) HIT family hydrolase